MALAAGAGGEPVPFVPAYHITARRGARTSATEIKTSPVETYLVSPPGAAMGEPMVSGFGGASSRK